MAGTRELCVGNVSCEAMLGVVSLRDGNKLVITWPFALHTTVPTFPVWNLCPGTVYFYGYVYFTTNILTCRESAQDGKNVL